MKDRVDYAGALRRALEMKRAHPIPGKPTTPGLQWKRAAKKWFLAAKTELLGSKKLREENCRLRAALAARPEEE